MSLVKMQRSGFLETILQVFLLVQFQSEYALGRRVLLDGQVRKPNLKRNDATAFLGAPQNMEDIINSPKFQGKQILLSDNADIWADALSEYDKMLRSGLKAADNYNQDTTGVQSQSNPFFGPHASQPRTHNDTGALYGIDASRSKRKSDTIMKVTHSDKIVKTDNGKEGSAATAAVVCNRPYVGKVGDMAAVRKMADFDLPSKSTEKLTVHDRVLENGQMTQSRMYGHCREPSPTGTVCFGVPSGCVEAGRCRIIVSFGYDVQSPDYVTVNFAGETFHSGVIAFGFSHDRFIGDDVVVYCRNTARLSKPAVALYLAFTQNDRNLIQTNRQFHYNNFCPKFGYQQSEMMACSFDLATEVYLDSGQSVDIFNTPHYLMLAFGHFKDSPVNAPNHGGVGYQHLIQFSEEPVILARALRNPKIIYPRSRILILLHAFFAVVSFIFLIPTGIFFAKYGREVGGYGADMFGNSTFPFWLLIHVCVISLSFVFILVSLVLILVELDFTWRSYQTLPMIHSVVGFLAYLLAFASFATGFFFKLRQYSTAEMDNAALEDTGDENMQQGSQFKQYLTWIHWAFGNIAYLCAILCVGVVGSLPSAQAPCVVQYFAFLHFGLYALAHFVLLLDTKRIAKILDDQKFISQRALLGPMIPWRKQDVAKLNSENEFHTMELWRGRRRVLIFFLLVSLICGVAISVLLILPVVLCR